MASRGVIGHACSMANSSRGIGSAVLIAGVLTLCVTVLRLVGELQGWNPALFSKEAGGGGALVGVGWLPIVIGLWFGRRLVQQGHVPPSTLRAALVALVGAAAMMGSIVYVATNTPNEQLMERMGVFMACCPLFLLVAWFAWGRAALAGLLYGILARVPVVVVQYVAIANNWGTHYEKVNPALGELDAAARGEALMMAQMLFWVPFTTLLVVFFAALGALTVRKRPA